MNRRQAADHSRAGESQAIPNAYYEHLLRLRASNPTVFQTLSPALRLACGYYEAAKREHLRLEEMKG